MSGVNRVRRRTVFGVAGALILSLAIMLGAPSGANAGPFGPCFLGDTPPPKLPDGVIRTPYSAQVQPSFPDASYQLISGTWPPGLAMNGSGLVSGTPNKNGRFAYTVSVRRDVVVPDPVDPDETWVAHCQWDIKGAVHIRSPLGARLAGVLHLPRTQ